MEPDVLPLLCCPDTHEPLEQGRDGGGREYLLCAGTSREFPIVDGIPRFLDIAGVTGMNKKYQELYDRIARFYDIPMKIGYFCLKGLYTQIMQGLWLGELEISDGARVLEVSIGTGLNIRFIPRDVSCFGLDISWGMLTQCRRNLSRWGLEAEMFHGEAENLPFQDAVFDVVFHVGGINFFNDKARAINEMIRVAKPGTKIVIVDENENFVRNFYQKAPVLRKYFKDREQAVTAPVDLVPEDMHEIKVEDRLHGALYCLSFRKPR